MFGSLSLCLQQNFSSCFKNINKIYSFYYPMAIQPPDHNAHSLNFTTLKKFLRAPMFSCTIRYDTINYIYKLYLPATKSSLICCTEPNKKNVNKDTKNKTEMLRINCPVIKSVEWVLRLEKSLWWERFVKEVGLQPAVKERGSYGWWEWRVDRVRRCGRSINRQVRDRGTGMRLTERTIGSWFQRRGEAYLRQRSVT